MPRPRVGFLGTGGALNPERYQASILVEAATTRGLLDRAAASAWFGGCSRPPSIPPASGTSS